MNPATAIPSTLTPPGAAPDPVETVAGRIPPPRSIEETGIPAHLLTDLAAKTMYYRGRATEGELEEWLGLERPVVDRLMESMKREGLLETMSQAGPLQFLYAMTERGQRRALDAFERDSYIGPAPVPYQRYLELQEQQGVRTLEISMEDIERALSHLVQPPETVTAIGAGVVSAGAVLLYGASGNGKSTVAAAVRRMLRTPLAVPHALDLGGRTMRMFDARVHEEVPGAASLDIDRRFVVCRRPMVTLGSELTLADLEAAYAETDRTYTAPPQMKANGGVLVVDDLGRQAVRPAELLNRWMAPMATGVDQLGLRSGEMLRVPFDVLLVFATNLEPRDLGDEAFLRRIRHKVMVPDPSREEYLEIFRRAAEAQGMAFERGPVEVILREFYEADRRPLRGSHPGDLLQNVVDFSKVDGRRPEMTVESLRRACEAYFVR